MVVWKGELVDSGVDAFGGAVAITVSLLLLQMGREERGGKVSRIAIAFLAMGILDAFHAIARPGGGFVLLHSTAALVGGFWFASIWLPDAVSKVISRRWFVWAVAGSAVGFGIYTLLFRETMPLMAQDGKFTLFTLVTNWLGGVLFLAGVLRIATDSGYSNETGLSVFAFVGVLLGIAGITFGMSSTWEPDWWFWHLLRLAAFVVVLWFVFGRFQRVSLSLMSTVESLNASRDELRKHRDHLEELVEERSAEIRRTNERLEEKIAQCSAVGDGLRLSEMRLESLLRISQHEAENIRELLDFALDEAIALTGSKLGYVYYYDEEKREFTLNSWSKSVMKECTVADSPHVYQLENTGMKSEAVRQRKAILLNDFQSPHPLKKGYPEGHAAIHNYLSVPVFSQHKIVAAVGVANKETDYDQSDVRQLTLLMNAVWNIVERRRAEEAILEKTEELDRFFSLSLDLLCIANTDGYFLRVNPAWERTLGYSVNELEGKRFLDLVHPDDQTSTLEAVGALASGEKVIMFVNRYRHKDGSYRWIEWSSAPCQAELIYAAARDITERKAAEEELRKHRDHLEELVGERAAEIMKTNERLEREIAKRKEAEETIQRKAEELDRFFSLSLDLLCIANTDGYFLRVNPAWERTLGYSVNELEGKRFLDLVHPDDQTSTLEAVAGVALGKQVSAFVNRYRHKNGSYRWFEWNSGPAWGELLYATARDITERKHAEEENEKLEAQLVQSQKMEAIGTLAGGVAHDFNNILTAIQGYTDLALMKMPEDDPLRRNLTEVRKASERAASLTRQLLLFSQRQAVAQKPVNLNKIVTDLMKMLGRIVGEHYKIETNLQADLWTVNADAGQIDQIIMNLVVNARDAMPSGGEITIATENVGADEEYYRQHPHARAGEHVCLSVRDSGTGMDKETLARIFEPFFTRKERGKGTGLGLAVAHGIMQKHDGWVDVESEPGKGSTFRVFIPAVGEKAQEEGPRPPAATEPVGKGERILLVEDETTIRALAEKFLAENGYVVFATDTVQGGLDVFEREGGNIDVVFSDIGLPDGTGVELVERILAKKPEIRALLASGYSSDADGLAAAQEKGLAYLQKPYSLPDVLRTLRELLDRK